MDLIPASEKLVREGSVTWPKQGQRMSLVGFRHLFLASGTMPISPGLNVACTHVVVLLKIVSWTERPYERDKDLADLAALLSGYLSPEDDRLYVGEASREGHYGEDACAWLLGYDLGRDLDLEESKRVQFLLGRIQDRADPLAARIAARAPLGWHQDEEEVRRRPPADTDVLLLEGTQVRRSSSPSRLATERAVEDEFVRVFLDSPGLVLVAFSAQNIDRLVTVYRAAIRARRELVVDLYAASIAKATGNANIPQVGFEEFRVWVPQSQRVRVKESGAFGRVNTLGNARIYPERLGDGAERRVMLFRGSMLRELEQACCLSGAVAIWSQWEGYLRDPSNRRLLDALERLGIPLRVLHTSGHAATEALQALVRAVNPGRVVPMHTEAPEGFSALFERVEFHKDGEWWEV